MAKKKSKKSNKKQIKLIVAAALLVLGLASFAMMFLPALRLSDSEDAIYSGMQVAFGAELVNVNFGGSIGSIGSSKLNFSILGVLGYILPLAAGVVVALLGRKNKIVAIVCTIVFVAAAVLVFLLPTYTTITYSIIIIGETTETPDWVLQYGSIISGSLSGVCALGSCYFVLK